MNKKNLFFLFTLFITACSSVKVPENFEYIPIKTRTFELATWQKKPFVSGQSYKIYIEGDGFAFDKYGRTTSDPTPKSTLVRELAFGDTSPNVVYLARPCQFIMSDICSARHWSSARFAPEVINSEYEAVKKIVSNNPVILIGFSGGAQVAGLIAAAKTGLNVQKIITIAGNLDHLAWTQYHNLPPLNESLNLESYKKRFEQIEQIHFVGEKDIVIPPFLIEQFVKDGFTVVRVPSARHTSGWEKIYPQIWNFRQ